MGKRKISIFSVLVLIVGLSGLSLGGYSLYINLTSTNQINIPEDNQPLARAFASSGHSVPDHTWVVVDFDVEDYDVTADFDIVTNRFICPTSGYYLISGKVTFLVMLAGENIYVGVFREGILEIDSSVYGSQTVSLSVSFTDIVYLNEGDYVEVRVYHTGSFDRSVFGNAEGTLT